MADMAEENVSYELPRASYPEEVGVESSRIQALINDFVENGVNVHSFMVIRHGKVAFETYREPYGPQYPHAMYSVSKSYTSAAMGFAISEGLVSLDTKVIDIFPEYRPAHFDEKLESMTVFHLLTMTAGKDVSLLSDKKKDDWIAQFFNSRWYAAPGEGWKYISENTYMCCAIIERLTGMTVSEYLAPRLYEPLGYGRIPFWERDHHGVEAGGWGIYVTLEELARFTECIAHGGVYAGRQVIPADYIERAVQAVVDNSSNGPSPNSSHGYGFFFWRCALENCYRLDGMFSQFGIVFEDCDASLIIQCGEIDEDKTRESIFRHLPDMFIDSKKSKDESVDIKGLPAVNIAAPGRRSAYEKILDSKTIKLGRNALLGAIGFPVSMLPLTVTYMSADKAGNMDNVVFRFGESTCTMEWDEGREHNIIECGMDGTRRSSDIVLAGIPFTALSTARWVSGSTLEVRMCPVEAVAERIMSFTFTGGRVKMVPGSVPTSSNMAAWLRDGVSTMIKAEPVAAPVRKIVMQLDKILDAPISGKIL